MNIFKLNIPQNKTTNPKNLQNQHPNFSQSLK
jgi:hypothetical protein